MQLNLGYHGSAFDKQSQMMNPRLNIIYAAYFLKELYNEAGTWAKAIAHYHSRKWHRGGQYANRVAQYIHDYSKYSQNYSKGPTIIPLDLTP
jgi:soluble lytic murein transglycosylase-like protein